MHVEGTTAEGPAVAVSSVGDLAGHSHSCRSRSVACRCGALPHNAFAEYRTGACSNLAEAMCGHRLIKHVLLDILRAAI